uniref:Integrase catalytic domain-containing protein n=1 Tax=Bursaphelenchus xylophilus TaxID=6326 RepID=A0A1I7RUL0_BURXY
MLRATKTQLTISINALKEKLKLCEQKIAVKEKNDVLVEITIRRDALARDMKKVEDRFTQFLEKLDDTDKSEATEKYIKEATDAITDGMHMDDQLCELYTKTLAQINNAVTPEAPPNIEREPRRTMRTLDIKIPLFDGTDLSQWPRFKQSLETKFKNGDYDGFEKCLILMESLRGPARTCAEAYELVAENFEPLMKHLESRYGNDKIIRHTLHAQLSKLTPTTNRSSDLRTFMDKFIAVYNQLKIHNPQMDVEQAEVMIMDKLPQWMSRQIWDAKLRSEEWNEAILFRTVDHALKVNEATSHMATRRDHPKMEKFRVNAVANGPEPWKKTPVEAKEMKFKKTKRCIFCEEEHYADECKKYNTVDARINRLKETRRCLRCGSKKHEARNCEFTMKCRKCSKNHHTAICFSQKNPEQKHEVKKTEDAQGSVVAATKINDDEVNCRTSLMTVNVQVESREEQITIFMDPGSEVTLITEETAQRLQLEPIKQSNVTLEAFNGTTMAKGPTNVYKIPVVLPNGDEKETRILRAIGVQQIGQVSSVVEENGTWTKKLVKPDVLLSAREFWTSFQRIRMVPNTDLFEVITKYGSSMTGALPKSRFSPLNTMVCKIKGKEEEEPEDLRKMLEKLWSMESIGIMDNPKINDDEEAMSHFAKHIKFNKEDGRYEVAWPYKDENGPTRNEKVCRRRLNQFWHQMQNDKETLKKCQEYFEEQIANNFLEDAPTEPTGPFVSYIPFQVVLTPHKTTTKLRIVLDASSAEKGGRSLNSTLLRGPIIMPDLASIIVKFRTNKIVVASDIQKAFMQLGLRKEDRDTVRILWLKDISKPPTNDNIRELRYTRIIFGATPSPFLLAATIQWHFKNSVVDEETRQIYEEVISQIYVDNLIIMGSDEPEVLKKVKKIHGMFKEMNMPLREYMTNSPRILEELKKDGMDCSEGQFHSILGYKWQQDQDTLTFKWPDQLDIANMTDAVAIGAKNFDLLGSVCPARLPIKLFSQKLARKKMGWKDSLSEEDLEDWKSVKKFVEGTAITIPRLCRKWEGEPCLHVFVDASGKAYGCVAYIGGEEQIPSNIFAKSRVAPMEGTTMPRMELMSAELGTKAIKFLETIFKFKKVTLWSDSKVVLHWINSTELLPRFVANRLQNIRRPDVEFRYINTKDNPADILSRGMSMEELQNCNLWWNGPSFLQQPEDTWPQELRFYWQPQEKTTSDEMVTIEHASPKMINKLAAPDDEVDILKGCPTWKALIHKMICILKFGSKSARQMDKHELWQEAVRRILMWEQRRSPPTEDQKKEVMMELRNGLWRTKHRMPDQEENWRIYIPHGQIMNMIIDDLHENSMHNGVPYTLALFYETFWTRRARQILKNRLRRCPKCSRKTLKPYRHPENMADLPKERVQRTRPFDSVGIDYHGPIKLKNDEQRYVVLFTCFACRAVHLEEAKTLSGEDFLKALRRFIACRGRPSFILSDNGTNLKSVATSVAPQWKTDERENVLQYCATNGITWKFTTPHGPWEGAVYERLMALLKKGLHVLKDKLPENFNTNLWEISAMINTRPLTYVEEDNLVLRPMDFLSPGSRPGAPIFDDSADPDFRLKTYTRDVILDEFKKEAKLLDKFWKKFRSEYLPILRSHQQKFAQSKTALVEPQIGALVILEEENVPRGEWNLGIVTKLPRSQDGQIRRAEVKMINDGRTYLRPLCQIYPTEAELRLRRETQQPTPSMETEKPVEIKKNSTRHYNLRPRSSLPIYVAILASIIIPLMADGNILPCREEDVPSMDRMRLSEYCVQQGKIVYEMDKPCWKNMKCENGHLRSEWKRGRLDVKCGEKCKCPKWATGCSFYDKKKLRRPDKEDQVDWSNVEEVIKPRMITPNPGKHLLPTIEVAWKRTFFVKSISLVHKEEMLCVNDEDERQRCTNATMESTYYVTENGQVPITAWGYMEIEHFENAEEKWEKYIYMLAGISISIIAGYILGAISVFLAVIRWVQRLTTLPFKAAFKLMKYLVQQDQQVRRRKLGEVVILPTILALSLAGTCMCCTDPITVNGKTRVCNQTQCSTEFTSRFAMNEVGEETCLLNKIGNKTHSKIELNIVQAGYECQEVEMAYTYSSEVRTESTLRCPLRGKCEIGGCGINYDEEFSKEAQNSIGRQNCEVVPGGIDHLCLLLTNACLYTRNYVHILDTNPIKVFKCRWKPFIVVDIKYDTPTKQTTQKLNIYPGSKVNIDHNLKLKAEVVEITEQRPEPGYYFAKNNSIYRTPEPPNLICQKPKIDQETCTYNGQCECRNSGTHKECECQTTTWKNEEWQKEMVNNMAGQTMVKETQEDIEVFIIVMGQVDEIETFEEKDECQFTLQKDDVKCTSKEHNILAMVRCENTTEQMPCRPDGATKKIRGRGNCEASCGRETMKFFWSVANFFFITSARMSHTTPHIDGSLNIRTKEKSYCFWRHINRWRIRFCVRARWAGLHGPIHYIQHLELTTT